ncbi:LOW QUALITY PROTEIN: gasdermin-B [Desmodus rotundus]|uniref:LOW QUALITY PROTEIN: gasdermin-B n=1 Tax=Desmodus rotundus TaxID=9430 RepID=UPI002380D347|nr:LOW QUALITY PROTEIN: gasdermin-B [Desmodus rotundus]
MPSVSETITKAVVHEMDAGSDMVEVRSIVDADRFHCLRLVKGKGGLFRRRYCSTDLTLEDILETEDGEERFDELDSGLPGQKSEFRVVDMVDCAGTVKLPKQITIKGGFHGSHEQSIMLLGSRVSQQYLEFLENRKLKRRLPTLFLSIRTRREDLCLVTETLQTTREETLKSERIHVFSQLDFCGLRCERKHQRAVAIPPNLVLGYRVKQLIFPSSERMNICFSGKTKSFPEEEDGDSSCFGKSLSLEGFRNMEEKVQDTVGGLRDLTEKERDVLSCLTKCLTSDGELQALEERVSEVLVSEELQVEGPADPLISSLFNAAGILVEARIEAILDFLDALKELSEEKELVAETLEKGTLPLLKDQLLQSGGLKSVLEQEWGKQPRGVGRDPEAQTVCTLYLVISILLQLSEKPAPAVFLLAPQPFSPQTSGAPSPRPSSPHTPFPQPPK